MILFRAGRHLVVGEHLAESNGTLQVRPMHVLGEHPLLLRPDPIEVNERMVIHREWTTPDKALQEADEHVWPLEHFLHESVMDLIADMRHVDLPRARLVAYERRGRGVGIRESTGTNWYSSERVLAHQDLAERLALEALKPVLESLDLYDRTRPEGILEQTRVLERSLHVYMKRAPFHDISEIHAGTDVAVAGYQNGCALIEADGEEFWIPLEEANILPTKKDDHYYFTLDGDRDHVPDPLNHLPSKVAIGAVTGSAQRDDNYNAQCDLPRVAGNFMGYDVPWIPNEDFGWLSPDVHTSSIDDALSAISKGVDPDKIAEQLLKRR